MMAIFRTRSRGMQFWHGAIAACAMFCSAPALAETVEELDLLSDASETEAGGVQLAQAQAAQGDLLEALSTLERVLAQHPKSAAARMLHAAYLCRTDDRQGGAIELRKLRAKDYPRETMAEARRLCGVAEGD